MWWTTLLVCIALLIVLITRFKFNTFLAFLIVSILAGLMLGVEILQIIKSVQKGIGDILGSLLIIIVTGAMLGKLVAESGAAQKIAKSMTKLLGEKNMPWAMMITGFLIGVPLFYNVGFVLVIPFIFTVAFRYNLPPVSTGIPMLAALSATHGFLPPHPSPSALVTLFHADMGITLFYGTLIALPAVIVAGPVFAKTLRKIKSIPLLTFKPTTLPDEKLPGLANSILTSLLPVILLTLATVLGPLLAGTTTNKNILLFAGNPPIVMLISLLISIYTLGIRMGAGMKEISQLLGDAAKDVAMLMLIIAGSGAFNQVLMDSGVNKNMTDMLRNWSIQPLIFGWFTAAAIRVCLGSATVAGLTAAGLIAPLMVNGTTNPNLMVLSIGAGSLMFSHVNDSGFWLFKEYFNLSIKDTIRSWSMMESIISMAGLIGVLTLNLFIIP